MRRLVHIVLLGIMLVNVSARSQIIMMDGDDGCRAGLNSDAIGLNVPFQGLGNDQYQDYSPLTDGIGLLLGLGGAYLLGRRRRRHTAD